MWKRWAQVAAQARLEGPGGRSELGQGAQTTGARVLPFGSASGVPAMGLRWAASWVTGSDTQVGAPPGVGGWERGVGVCDTQAGRLGLAHKWVQGGVRGASGSMGAHGCASVCVRGCAWWQHGCAVL